MTDMARAAGTPFTITVKGKEYRIAPITFAQQAAWEQWARETLMREALGYLGDIATASDRARLIQQMMAGANAGIAAEMTSYRGTLKQFELALRREQPEITEEEVTAVLDSFGMDEAKALLDQLAGLGEPDEIALRAFISEIGLDRTKEIIAEIEEAAQTTGPPSVGKRSPPN